MPNANEKVFEVANPSTGRVQVWEQLNVAPSVGAVPPVRYAAEVLVATLCRQIVAGEPPGESEA